MNENFRYLEKITVHPNNPKYSSLNGSSLRNVDFNYGLQVIGQSAFAGNHLLNSITLPSTLTWIGAHAFSETNIQTVNFQGTQAQWEEIGGPDAGLFTDVTINFNYSNF